jgi:hypothetical protein
MMMQNKNHMTVPCLFVPEILFRDVRYRDLTITAKLLYSLLLERLEYAGVNGWVDAEGDFYVLYPKNELQKDLNCGRHRVDQAVQELQESAMVLVMIDNGRPNRYYLYDITSSEGEKEPVQETHAFDAGVYLPASGELDRDLIAGEASDFGMELALCIMDAYEGHPEQVIAVQYLANEMYEERPGKVFLAVIEMMAEMLAVSDALVQDMKACGKNKKARKIFLSEMLTSFNAIIDDALDKS